MIIVFSGNTEKDREAQKKHLDFESVAEGSGLYKDTYMTGILPIKKYGSHSALNMFTEYSMTNPREMAEFFGFTEDEVKMLCASTREALRKQRPGMMATN